ncbi:MAG: hypothetical protein R3B70_41980 [Polyangiaceae bacterium]
MSKSLYRVEGIHNPVLPGKPLLLQPGGLLVRWPARVPMPQVGDWFSGTAITVPPNLRETVLTLLFAAGAIDKCEAARRLAQNKDHRRYILCRVYSRPYVQHMLSSIERLGDDQRRQLEAMGESLSFRRLRRASSEPSFPTNTDTDPTDMCPPEKETKI